MPADAASYDVVVAGLGAMGSAACWRLARRGLRVLGLDRFEPPHSHGSSHGASRVIREMAFEHPRYVPLVRRAYALWDELERAAGRSLIIPTGAIYLGPPDSSVVAGSRASAVAHEVPSEELSAAQVRRRWPALCPAEGEIGLFERRAGILRPEASVQAMLDAARGAGAELSFGEPLLSWSPGVEVRTGRRTAGAKALVLATGPWMLEELSRLAPGSWVERVVQHWFEPARDAELLEPNRCPIYLWEDAAGLIFYGFPLLEGAVKCAIHHRGESVTAETVRREVSEEEIARTRERLERLLPAAAGRWRRSAVCLYTNTADGDFIIDRHPSDPAVIVASPCSGIGFKFAPVIGEIVARMAAGEEQELDLEPFSLGRFRTRSAARGS